MKCGLIFTLMVLAVFRGFSQDTTITLENKSKPVILNKITSPSNKTKSIGYEHEFSMGGKLSTTGWSIFGDYTKDINLDKKRVYYFELGFINDPKEAKRVNEFTIGPESPKPFIYGKQNSFFNLKAALGQKLMIGEKAEKSGFQVSFNYAGGVSAGFIKPYYLEIFNTTGETSDLTRAIKYTPETESLFLDATSIYGASGFSIGFNEIKFAPGIFAKSGFNFDWATYDDFVKSMEVGLGTEVYLKEIPILISENNKPYFVYLYLSLQFGKKW